MPLILKFKQQNIEQKEDKIATLSELLQKSESQKELYKVDLAWKIELEKAQEVQIGDLMEKIEGMNRQYEYLNIILGEKEVQLSISKHETGELKNEMILKNKRFQKLEQHIGELNEMVSSLQSSNDENLNQINALNMQLKHQNAELLLIKKSFTFKLSRVLIIPIRLFRPSRLISLIRARFVILRNTKLIKQSGLFDEMFYIKNNHDVKTSGMSPTKHYLLFGGFEGRNPSEKFDSRFYLGQNLDVKASGMNPLVHYLKYGKPEGRLPQKSNSLQVVKNQTTDILCPEEKLCYLHKMTIKFPERLQSFILEDNGNTEFVNTYFDRIYVINLRRRQNKLIEIIQKLKRLNIKAEIIEAVDGYISPHIDEYETYKNNPLGLENAHQKEILEKRKLIYSPGVWGHLKSNRLILEDSIAKGYQRILILEDDVVFIKDFHREFAKFARILSGKEWRFIYLGASQHCWEIPDCIVYSDKSVTEYDPIQPYYHPLQTVGSFALAIHQSQFRSIIDKIDEMNCPFDWIYKCSFKYLSKECYVAQPNLIIADSGESDNRPADVTSEQKALAIKRRKWDLTKYDFILEKDSRV